MLELTVNLDFVRNEEIIMIFSTLEIMGASGSDGVGEFVSIHNQWLPK